MTDDNLRRARRAAAAYADAVRQTQQFLDEAPDGADQADLAEYANLAAREEHARAQRQEAFADLGLGAPSIDASAQ